MISLTDTGSNMSYNLNFHQTFKPEREYISRLLTVDNLTATKEEISHEFGIPTGKSSGKVEVAILYAKAAKLLDFSKKKGQIEISRTRLGDIIHEHDAYLEHKMTQLLIHYFFSSNKSFLTLWNLFFTSYRIVANQVNIKDFQSFAAKKMNIDKINTSPLVGTYISKDTPIVDLDIIRRIEKDIYEFGEIEIAPKFVSFYLYFIYNELLSIDNNRIDFTLDELIMSGFNKIFGWDEQQLRWLLELGEYGGYFSLNKQFDNYHIHLNIQIDELLEKLY